MKKSDFIILTLVLLIGIGVAYFAEAYGATVKCKDLTKCKNDAYTCYCAQSSWDCSNGSGSIDCCNGTHLCELKEGAGGGSGGGGGPTVE